MLPAKTPREANGFQSLLQNRDFLALWGGQIFSQVADKVLLVLSIALLTTYRIPPTWTGSASSALMVASTIPAILFGVAAGILVDRFPKKQILVISDLARAVAILALIVLPQHLAALLAITFVVSTVTQVFAPAEQAIIPLVVDRHSLLSANAIFTSTHMTSLIIGFAAGETVLTSLDSWAGVPAQIGFLAGLYVLGAICAQLVQVEEDITVSRKELMVSPLKDLRLGWEYLLEHPILLKAMMQLAILFSAIAALPILSIKLTAQVGLLEKQFGLLVAPAGVGLVLGAGLLAIWGNRLRDRPLTTIGFTIMAAMLIAFNFVDRLAIGVVMATILGLGASAIAVPMQTLIQEKTPEEMRGKVFGFQNNAVNIALSLPLVITGPLADRFGLQSVLFVMAAAVIAAAIWAYREDRSTER
jgi:predicted MFS family arabinose efflux permease